MRRTKWRNAQILKPIHIINGRLQSTAPASYPSRLSWTTSRVFFVSAIASSLAYLIGVNYTSSHAEELRNKDRFPVYGSFEALETVPESSNES